MTRSSARTEPMDASADVVRSPEGDGTLEGVEPGVSTGAKCRWNADVKSQLKADASCPS